MVVPVTFAGKTVMYIEFRKNDRNSFLREIMKAKDVVVHRRESLIRHCTMTAATLIGLATVFGDLSGLSTLPRILTLSGVLFLCLTVLVGVLFCFWTIVMQQKELENCIKQYREENYDLEELYVHPVYVWFARIFPWLLCAGILLLTASVSYPLLFH